MGWLESLGWGAFGGFAMEALDYIIAVRRWRKLPWNVGASSLVPGARGPSPAEQEAPDEGSPGILAYSIAAVLRVVVGAGTAAAVASTVPKAMSAWLAVLVGATSPHVLEKVTLFVPLVLRIGVEGIAAVQQQSMNSSALSSQGSTQGAAVDRRDETSPTTTEPGGV
jgi:hypothetical protein